MCRKHLFTFFFTFCSVNLCMCRLFRQYLIFVLVHQMASGLFRLLAALGRNMIVASTFGSFALLVLFVNGGFVLSRGMI